MIARLRPALLPLAAFLAAVLAHLGWHALFPDRDPAQDRWAPVATVSWFEQYVNTQGYWLSYSYGLSAAFATIAVRRWWLQRQRRDAGAALGSAAASGFLAAASCWLIGCCGSPMLGVYLAFLGPAVLPFAKPAVAMLTTLSVVLGYWWLGRTPAAAATSRGPCACGEAPAGLSSETA